MFAGTKWQVKTVAINFKAMVKPVNKLIF